MSEQDNGGKHTPAPWVIRGQDIIGNELNGYICKWSGRSANASLIAAAPDLFAEIEKQIVWLNHIRPQITAPESVMLGFDQAIKYLNAVIAKATA